MSLNDTGCQQCWGNTALRQCFSTATLMQHPLQPSHSTRLSWPKCVTSRLGIPVTCTTVNQPVHMCMLRVCVLRVIAVYPLEHQERLHGTPWWRCCFWLLCPAVC